ncbi:uncharacterized protein LOC117413397 isoform X2 [Acipenser ruthenus]|nr:uncharacterized protein LOC117413397 isoform X2 [Acipenser ruthenus]XP_033878433.3 uncharacterized protein LOC117413397 isoform X2 [Acipenser ruthenus]
MEHDRIKMSLNSSLSIRDVRAEDAGVYECCFCSNKSKLCDTVKNVSLFVLQIVRDPPSGDPVMLHSTLSLQCSVACDRLNAVCNQSLARLAFTWRNHPGNEIETRRERQYSIQPAGGASYLRFQVEQSDHERKLKCVLSVDGKEKAFAEYQVFITVTALDPNTSEIVYVAEGELVLLPCVGISSRTEGRHVEWSFQAIGDQSRTLLNVSAPAYPRVNPRETVSLLPNASLLNVSAPAHPTVNPRERVSLLPNASLLNVSAPAHPTVNPRERVSLLPNASLLIQRVQSPDTGTYHCRRDEQEKYHMLTVCVLTVNANVSSPVSKGTEVVVNCSLLCDHTPQDAVLQWMDSNGTLLESNTTLSTGPSAQLVIPSAYNMTLRCRLQDKERERASVEYTIHVTEEQGSIQSNQTVLLPVLLGIVAACVAIAAVLILLLRGRKTGDKEDSALGVELNSTHQASQVEEEECEIHYATLEIRQPARDQRRDMTNEQVIYCLTVQNK